MSPENQQKNDHEASIAGRIAAQLAQSIADNGQASFVVCGGSSPLGLFAALANGTYKNETTSIVDWSRVTITLVDDRLVPTDDDNSNQKLLHQHLWYGELAAARFVPLTLDGDAANITRPFDVMLLGMGPDGHFASLFPDMVDGPALSVDTPPIIIETDAKGSPKLPRISMNLAMILQSKMIMLLVKGAQKQEVLAAAETDRSLPVHALLTQRVTPIEIITKIA